MALLVAGVGAMYHLLVRPWHGTWGATEEEVNRQLRSDELLTGLTDETTRAITVKAPRDDVWPWTVQLGQGRGGFYSYT